MGALLSKINIVCVGVFPSVAYLLIVLYNLLMTKIELVHLAGSQSELARILRISRAAVCLWKKVPELRLRQLRDLRPEWFLV